MNILTDLAGCVDEGVYFIMIPLKWSIQLCIYRTVYTVQKDTFCTEVYGASDHRMYSGCCRTAIKIHSTFQRLHESCLFLPSDRSVEISENKAEKLK